jgi:hypothetical protein
MALFLAPAAAGTRDKPAILGNPNLIYQKQLPAFAPPAQTTISPSTAQQAPIYVPSNQIGFRNPTSSNVAAIIDMGNGQSHVVLLKAHQFETVDCSKCGDAIRAVVPHGSKPKPGDFSTPLTKGNVYEFDYDDVTKRWVLIRK